MAEIRKNLPYSLEVWQGNKKSLVGSDIEPVELLRRDEDILSWDGVVVDVLTHSFWLVRQDGKPVVIEQTTGNSAQDVSWEAYELPKLTEVLLNKDIEEK